MSQLKISCLLECLFTWTKFSSDLLDRVNHLRFPPRVQDQKKYVKPYFNREPPCYSHY